jgi:Tfp pilus assembly protein PilN
MPAWSVVFSEMADKMPDQMWLTSIRSSNIGETGQSRKLEINGLSVSHSSIAQFVKQLEDSKSFSNTLLVSTLKDNNLYKFVINSDVDFPEAKW